MNKTKIEWVKNPDGSPGYSWNPIIEYPGYYVDTDGNVLSWKRIRLRHLKPIVAKDGHLYVFLYRDGLMRKEWVHRLILATFTRDPFPNEECRHLNGNPSDNRLSNLKWGTRQDNANDRMKHGRYATGENAVSHKLTEQDVLEIRRRCGSESSRQLAQEYGVSHTTILGAVNGHHWRCLK